MLERSFPYTAGIGTSATGRFSRLSNARTEFSNECPRSIRSRGSDSRASREIEVKPFCTSKIVTLAAGVHELLIEYEQAGGGRGWRTTATDRHPS